MFQAPIAPVPLRSVSVGMRCNRPASFRARVEWLRLHLASAFRQNLDASFRFFELLAARFTQLGAPFEEVERPLEGQIARFHFFDDSIELAKSFFESERLGGCGVHRRRSVLVGHRLIIRGAAVFCERLRDVWEEIKTEI